MQEALEQAILELALGAPLAVDDGAAIEAWFERHHLDEADRAFLRRTGIDQLSLYRQLIRAGLLDAIDRAIPRAKARLGPIFDEYFDRFLAERGPRTRYLRDVTDELLDFCEPSWARDERVAPYLIELARHEALRILVGSLPVLPRNHEPGELDLDRGVDFIEATRIAHHAHAVHRLPDDDDDRTVPERKDTWLLVYRSPEHVVRYLELTPLAAGILGRLLLGRETLRGAMLGACQAAGVGLDGGVIEGAAQVLADLAERGALLGASPAHSRTSR